MKFAVISDIHANLEALSTVLDKCKEVGVEKYLCLGDIAGYNASPKECMRLIRSLNLGGVVKGNYDEFVGIDDELVGFESSPRAKQVILWTRDQLDQEEKQWLLQLPMKKVLNGITLVHATLDAPNAWGGLFDFSKAEKCFSCQTTQLCFCGHTHVPIAFAQKTDTNESDGAIIEVSEWVGGSDKGLSPGNTNRVDKFVVTIQAGWKYILNVGSVGQPRNRDPRTSFAVYNSDKQTITRYALPYDIDTAGNRIIENKLPKQMTLRLVNGN